MAHHDAAVSEPVTITKLVHGGQGLGELPNGKKVFVWNVLPGETVRVRLIKQKHSYAEAIAEDILQASAERIAPREANYLATSPWQMMDFAAENRYKADIAAALFAQQQVVLPTTAGTTHDDRQWHYRNKMEYSFWGDDAGLHLAMHQRGSHGKQAVDGCALAMPAVDAGAQSTRSLLEKLHVRAGDVKTIIVRCTQQGDAVGSLFVRSMDVPELGLPDGLQGLRVYHSNPQSPASVPTKKLYERGDAALTDTLLGEPFTYDADSFFQVNLPVFECALQRIREQCDASEVTDLYAGVGSIGLSVARGQADLVELYPATAAMARINAGHARIRATVAEVSAERSLEHIVGSRPVIVDPPRAGLHETVAARILEVRPPQVVYLSCNPATQARDLARLQQIYAITYFEVFNFFPRTPHIETLAILRPKPATL